MASTVSYARLALTNKRGAAPVYLIHHITDRCNAKCKHCFIIHDGSYAIPDGVVGGSVLTLSEIARLTRTLGPNLYTVQLTGGEPLLRADLLAITRNYFVNSAARYVQVCTNGQFTDRILALAETVMSEDPSRGFGFVISVDDLGQLHDQNRDVDGLFNALTSTLQGLHALRESFARLQVSVNVTVTRLNQDHLLDIYEFLTRKLGVTNVLSTLIRGSPSERAALGVDTTKYERFVEHCAKGWFQGRHAGFNHFLEARLVNAQNVLTRRNNVRLLRHLGEGQVCYAGDLSGVIYADGTVAFCEEVPLVVGNVRDWNLDFMGLWRSATAERVRSRKAATPCYCTHECFAVCNVLFNVRNWPKLAVITARGGHGSH